MDPPGTHSSPTFWVLGSIGINSFRADVPTLFASHPIHQYSNATPANRTRSAAGRRAQRNHMKSIDIINHPQAKSKRRASFPGARMGYRPASPFWGFYLPNRTARGSHGTRGRVSRFFATLRMVKVLRVQTPAMQGQDPPEVVGSNDS